MHSRMLNNAHAATNQHNNTPIMLSLLAILNIFFVSFADKPVQATPALSPRAVEQRAKWNIAIDDLDYPVHAAYLDSLRQHGATICHTSRWMNGATCSMTDEQAAAVALLPFVTAVEATRLDRQSSTVSKRRSMPAEAMLTNHALDEYMDKLNTEHWSDGIARAVGEMPHETQSDEEIKAFEMLMGVTILVSPLRAKELAEEAGCRTRQEIEDYFWKKITVRVGDLKARRVYAPPITRDPLTGEPVTEDSVVPLFAKGQIHVIVVGDPQGSNVVQGWSQYSPHSTSIDTWR